MIIHGDCLEVMRGMDANSVDAIVTDPPFFAPASHYQSRISWGRCYADLSILGQFFFDVANEYKRLLKPSGHLFVFCNDESYPVFFPVVYGLWDFTAGLIWDKGHVGLGKIFRHQFEMILWASNKGAIVYNDGKLHSDILRYSATPSKNRLHPVEKPAGLMAELLTITTKPGDVVLDSFMGAGATGMSCQTINREFIGIELNSRYCEIAKRRIYGTLGMTEARP